MLEPSYPTQLGYVADARPTYHKAHQPNCSFWCPALRTKQQLWPACARRYITCRPKKCIRRMRPSCYVLVILHPYSTSSEVQSFALAGLGVGLVPCTLSMRLCSDQAGDLCQNSHTVNGGGRESSTKSSAVALSLCGSLTLYHIWPVSTKNDNHA